MGIHAIVFKKMEKQYVELHTHFCGMLNENIVHSICNETGNSMPLDEIREKIVITGKCSSFAEFLSKFKIYDVIEWNESTIDIAVNGVCKHLADNNIKYSEISTSLNKYTNSGWDRYEILDLIRSKFDKYSLEYGVEVGILLAIRYDSDIHSQTNFFDMVDSNDIIGVDMVGNESYINVEFHKKQLQKWYDAGKQTRVHIGELPEHIASADKVIRSFPINRVAHGIHCSDSTFDIANKRGIQFDLALHSNIATGSVESIHTHPISRMIDHGCTISLSSDDCAQLSTGIEDEYKLLSTIVSEDKVNAIWQTSENYYRNLNVTKRI